MQFGTYTFTLNLTDDAQLPYYKGSTFRGVLGHALKQTVCALKNQTCDTCVLRSNCTYAMVFETAHAVPLPENARVSSAPHPLVLLPPLTRNAHFARGDALTCTLHLFGRSTAISPILFTPSIRWERSALASASMATGAGLFHHPAGCNGSSTI